MCAYRVDLEGYGILHFLQYFSCFEEKRSEASGVYASVAQFLRDYGDEIMNNVKKKQLTKQKTIAVFLSTDFASLIYGCNF